MDQTSEESRLVGKLRDGSDDAVGDLFDLYRERLKRIVQFRLDYRIAGRISQSDVIQETYIAAVKRVDHFREKPDMNFFVWLRLLIQQQLTDLHREHLQAEKRDVRKEISIDQKVTSPHTSMAMAACLVGRMTSPSHALSRVERIAKVEEALSEMEEIDREVIALRHFEELTNLETAEVLGIQPHAASKRYVRAIKRLKEIVSQIPGFSDA